MGDIFQKKIDKLFSAIQNVTGIVNDILIASFDMHASKPKT